KRAYCLKTQPATGETYPKSDLFNKAATGETYPKSDLFNKAPRGYTYIGLVKNLINEGEGHIWWKI
ncbi:hypothetical protein ACR2XL_25675, partial [Klebsiella pneumoniae]